MTTVPVPRSALIHSMWFPGVKKFSTPSGNSNGIKPGRRWLRKREDKPSKEEDAPRRLCREDRCSEGGRDYEELQVSAAYEPGASGESYQAKLQEVLLYDRRLATAYRLKEGLRAIFHLPAEEVRLALEKWRRRAWSSRIPEFIDLQRKIRRHMDAIIATVTHQISNARVEATNNKIKLTIRMAYGFRNIDNLIALIYLRCGGRVIYLPEKAPRMMI